MTDSMLEAFRKRLPLKAQIGYGWLKYKLKPHPEWDDKEFIRYYRWLEKTQWWSREEHEGLQLEQLRALVKHAYDNVPYYRRVFDKQRVRPEDIVTLDDLQKLPLLTKADVIDNFEDLVALNVDRSNLVLVTTSGSTGAPLGVYRDKYTAFLHDYALLLLQCSWAGYQIGDRMVNLRGSVLPESRTSGRRAWWGYNPGRNELILSSYDMTEENMFRYVQKIKEFKPKFIYTFPSSIEILARFLKRNSINITTVNAIICTAETLYPQQRKLIESAFGCPVFSRYAMTERAVEAVECEHHQGYHINMENGVLELLDRDNEPIRKPGVAGRVVGTGFDTFGMPLIRYVTNDVAEYSPNSCSCKRKATMVQEFKGRITEFIVSKTKTVVSLSALNLHSSIYVKIRELKYIQEREGELVAQIAKAPNFSEAEVAREFLDELYDRLDKDEFDLKIVFVDSVPRTGRGKIGLLDQRLPAKNEYVDYIGNETGSFEH